MTVERLQIYMIVVSSLLGPQRLIVVSRTRAEAEHDALAEVKDTGAEIHSCKMIGHSGAGVQVGVQAWD